MKEKKKSRVSIANQQTSVNTMDLSSLSSSSSPPPSSHCFRIHILGLIEYYGAGLPTTRMKNYTIYHGEIEKTGERALFIDSVGLPFINENFSYLIEYDKTQKNYNFFPSGKGQFGTLLNKTVKIIPYYFDLIGQYRNLDENENPAFELKENDPVVNELSNMSTYRVKSVKEIKIKKINYKLENYINVFSSLPIFDEFRIINSENIFDVVFTDGCFNNHFLKTIYERGKQIYISQIQNEIQHKNLKKYPIEGVTICFYENCLTKDFFFQFWNWVRTEFLCCTSSSNISLTNKIQISKLLFDNTKDQKEYQQIIECIDYMEKELLKKSDYFDSIISYEDSSITIQHLIGFLKKRTNEETEYTTDAEAFFHQLATLQSIKNKFSSNTVKNWFTEKFHHLLLPLKYDEERNSFVKKNFKEINWNQMELKSYLFDIHEPFLSSAFDDYDLCCFQNKQLSNLIHQKNAQSTNLFKKKIVLLDDNETSIESFPKKVLIFSLHYVKFEDLFSKLWEKTSDKSSLSMVGKNTITIIRCKISMLKIDEEEGKNGVKETTTPKFFEERELIIKEHKNMYTTAISSPPNINIWKKQENIFFSDLSILIVSTYEKKYDIVACVQELNQKHLNEGKKYLDDDKTFFFNPCSCKKCGTIWSTNKQINIYLSPKKTYVNPIVKIFGKMLQIQIGSDKKAENVYIYPKIYQNFCWTMKNLFEKSISNNNPIPPTLFNALFTKILVFKENEKIEILDKKKQVKFYISEKIRDKSKIIQTVTLFNNDVF